MPRESESEGDDVTISTDNVGASFLLLPADQKILVLSCLSHELTVNARGIYPGQVEDHEAAEKLCTYNEVQHNVTSQLRHMLSNNEKRYPDNVFIDIIFEKARNGGCEGDLIAAFRRSLPNNS